jgi:hypothetical protein
MNDLTVEQERDAYKRAAERAENKLNELGWVQWPVFSEPDADGNFRTSVEWTYKPEVANGTVEETD